LLFDRTTKNVLAFLLVTALESATTPQLMQSNILRNMKICNFNSRVNPIYQTKYRKLQDLYKFELNKQIL